jgi:hypothetical protein
MHRLKFLNTLLLAAVLLPIASAPSVAKCKWIGDGPICNPLGAGCPNGWKFARQKRAGCLTGSKILCCIPDYPSFGEPRLDHSKPYPGLR